MENLDSFWPYMIHLLAFLYFYCSLYKARWIARSRITVHENVFLTKNPLKNHSNREFEKKLCDFHKKVCGWYIYFTFSNAAAPNAVLYFGSKKCSKFFNFQVLLDILKIIEKINITWKSKYTITKNSFCMIFFRFQTILKGPKNVFCSFEKCSK